jgi:SAM-dependent methyltransferase
MVLSIRAPLRAVAARRAHAALAADIGRALAGAGIDADTSLPRPCPVCRATDSAPAFTAPVYAFRRCRGCTLVYTPRLIRPEVLRARYETSGLLRASWLAMRADAADADPARYDGLLEPLLERAPTRGAAVDVGCRFGGLVAALRPRFDEAIGLELDPATARAAVERRRVDVRSVRLQDLDRPRASVDLVVFNQVLEHIADLGSLLSAAYRLLRPGGVLYVGVPHGDSLGMRLGAGAHPFVATHRHINLFTVGSLAALARAAGFRIVELGCDDALDVGGRVARVLARRAHLPSRLGAGAHLELVGTKGA